MIVNIGYGWSAEEREGGQWYVSHDGGGGAMATRAETAMIRAILLARTEASKAMTKLRSVAYLYKPAEVAIAEARAFLAAYDAEAE